MESRTRRAPTRSGAPPPPLHEVARAPTGQPRRKPPNPGQARRSGASYSVRTRQSSTSPGHRGRCASPRTTPTASFNRRPTKAAVALDKRNFASNRWVHAPAHRLDTHTRALCRHAAFLFLDKYKVDGGAYRPCPPCAFSAARPEILAHAEGTLTMR